MFFFKLFLVSILDLFQTILIDFYFIFILGGFFVLVLYQFIFYSNNIENNCIDKQNVWFLCFFIRYSLYYSISIFAYHILLFLIFNYSSKPFQIYSSINFFGIYLDFGVDGISLLFLLLTSFIIPLCILIHYYWPVMNFLQQYSTLFRNQNDFFLNRVLLVFLKKSQLYLILLLFLNIVLIIFFTTLDLLVFYITLELSMIPLFFTIGWFGSRSNKIKAAYYIFLYTIIGSIPFFIGLIFLYFLTGSTNLCFLYSYTFDVNLQKFFWILFFIPFAVKVPIIPFHVWLPEAHVEAPTEGSVLLAGLLLKLGVYGLIRFLIPLFPAGWFFFSSFFYTLCLVSLVYISVLIFSQTDLKKIIAYSSIAHMNFAVLGLFSLIPEGIQGSVFVFYTHGIISSGLFICIGCLYARFYTRLLSYYSGLTFYFPIFSFFFFFFILGNMSFPGMGSFIGELLILLGVFSDSFLIGFISVLGSLFCTFYSILLYTKICFGMPNFFKYILSLDTNKTKSTFFLKNFDSKFCCFFNNKSLSNNTFYFSHLNLLSIKDFFLIEYLILGFLFILMIFTGFFPMIYLNFVKLFSFSVESLIY